MKAKSKLFWVALSSAILLGCQSQDGGTEDTSAESQAMSTEPLPNRWYSEAQVASGKVLFVNNCASCHKADASGTKDWKAVDSNGKYPPPPLNGTAHTWHHSMDILRRTIQRGGVALGGVMPGFANILDDSEIDEVIAYFQSTWASDKYSVWLKRNE